MEAPMQEGGRAPGIGAHRDGQAEKDEEGVSREGVAGGGFLLVGRALLCSLLHGESCWAPLDGMDGGHGCSGNPIGGSLDLCYIWDEAPSSSMHCSPWRPCVALLVLPLDLAMLSPAPLLALMG